MIPGTKWFKRSHGIRNHLEGWISPLAPHRLPWSFAVLTSPLSWSCPGAGGMCPQELREHLPRTGFLLWATPVTRNECFPLCFLGRRKRSNSGKVAVLRTCRSQPTSACALVTGKVWSSSGSRICAHSSSHPQHPWHQAEGCSLCLLSLASWILQTWVHKFRHKCQPSKASFCIQRDRNL